MPFGDTIGAARADVTFATNTGTFKADMAEVEALYSRTTGAMTDEALKLAVAQDRLNRSIAKSGPESAAAGRATLAYRAQVDELAKSEMAAAAAAQRAARQRLQAYRGAAQSIGSTLTRYVTAPTAIAAAGAVKLAYDFQGSMRLIQTQAGAGAHEVNYASDAILRLVRSGDSFGQTANTMAKGLFGIESEGVRGARALEILRVAAAGAAVGQTDLTDTADALTSAMHVYDVAAGGAGRTMATLNAIVGAGKMHLADLTAAMRTKYLPVAKQLGVPLDQAGAALDVFTKAGVPAESAATNLTTALIKILNPSASAEKSLGLLGLTSTQLADELQQGGLTSGLKTLAEHYDQLVHSQGRVVANQTIFSAFGGTKGGGSVLALIQQYDTYLKSLQQIQKQSNPAMFWKDVAATMHEPAQQIRQDIAKITAEGVQLGNELGPVVADVVGDVTKLGDAFAALPGPVKNDLGVLLAVLAIGGPVFLGVSGLLRLVLATGKAVDYMGGRFLGLPTKAGPAIGDTDTELQTLRESLAATTGEVVGLETAFQGLPAAAGPAIAETEAEVGTLGATTGARAGLGGLLGRAGLYAGGGLIAGQVIGGLVPDQAGQSLSRAAQFAGIGAGIGTFFPEFGGPLAGAAIAGLVGGISTLIHDGPSFTQQVAAMGQDLNRLGAAAAASQAAIAQLQGQIANDRVGRDQAREELAAARAEEKATRGTSQHAAALDRLRAAQANLNTATTTLKNDTADLTKKQQQHEAIVRKDAAGVNGLVGMVSRLSDSTQIAKQRLYQFGDRAAYVRATTGSAAEKLHDYVGRMNDLADSIQKSDPKLAAAIRLLVKIARSVRDIPSHKTVDVVIRAILASPTTKAGDLARAQAEDAFYGIGKNGKSGKPGRSGSKPTFTTTIPIKLQVALAKAQFEKNVAQERKILKEMLAFLERELKLAKTPEQRLAAYQALQAVESQLDSLTKTTVNNARKRKTAREKAYQARVDEEAKKLQLNEQRAQLAEERAGQNTKALDRAYKAELKALNAEIAFDRKEAHDQQLSLKERQKYAAMQIAAEKAKAKIKHELQAAKKAAKKAANQADSQFLSQLRDIYLQYASNVQQAPTTPFHLEVNQTFPAPPTDQHRQARYALAAMQATFGS